MKNILKRAGFYAVSIVAALLLQTVICPAVPALVNIPNFLLIVTVSVAILRGRKEGMIVGVICGLLADCMSGGFVGFYAIAYLWIGYLNGLLSHFLTRDLVLVPILALAANEVVYSAYVYVFRYMLRNKLDFLSYANSTMMPELVETVIVSMILYWVIMTVNEALETGERRGERRFA